jgi:hypothetical protein
MHTRRPLGFLIAIVLLSLVATPLFADPPVTVTHIRPTSPELQSLVDEGIERSPAFRALVARLEASSVIAYVSFREFPEKIVEGRLVFIGATKGLRYLQIYIESALPHEKHLALLGHEFRHALEIAAEPAVVDSLSMGRYYQEIGYRVMGPPHQQRYETHEAIDSARHVLSEVIASIAAEERAVRD